MIVDASIQRHACTQTSYCRCMSCLLPRCGEMSGTCFDEVALSCAWLTIPVCRGVLRYARAGPKRAVVTPFNSEKNLQMITNDVCLPCEVIFLLQSV
jgi:hypothetical protein